MKPLSTGHYDLLKRFNLCSPSNAGDLLTGVLICSMEPHEFVSFVSGRGLTAKVMKWGRAIGFFEPAYFSWPIVGAWLKRRYGKLVQGADANYLSGQISEFQDYIKKGLSTLGQ